MNLVGSEREVSLPFESHKIAEDYVGAFASSVSLKGSYKVIKVVDKYQSYEDTIEYNLFLQNQQAWKLEDGYQCKTLTGKSLFVPFDELNGNSLVLEGYWNGEKYQIGLYHLDDIYVSLGDVIDDERVLGTQGNTGLVLSSCSQSDRTFGTHLHVEVVDSKGNFVDPRDFATEKKVLSLKEEENIEVLDVDEENVSREVENSIKQEITNNLISQDPLFVCPKDGVYYVTLHKGEHLYIM